MAQKDKTIELRDIRLSVAGHWDIMSQQASDEHKELINSIKINDPKIPIISCIDCQPNTTRSQVTQSLVIALRNTVNFKGWIQYWIDNDIEQYVEFSARGSMLKFVKDIKLKYKFN
jgi:acyl transferase domain-containing protein